MTCHAIQPPQTHEEMKKTIAPPIGNVLHHLRMDFKTPEEIKTHINDFVMNPTLEKAICPSVKRFGLMPSMKDQVTKEELNSISEFLLDVIAFMQNSHNKNKSHNGGSCSSGGCSGGACKTK